MAELHQAPVSQWQRQEGERRSPGMAFLAVVVVGCCELETWVLSRQERPLAVLEHTRLNRWMVCVLKLETRAAKAASDVVDAADAEGVVAAGVAGTVGVVAVVVGVVGHVAGVAEGTVVQAVDNVAAGAAVYNSVASRCPWKPRLAYTGL